MFYTLSKIHPDDRRGMAQVRALLEQEGISLDGNLDYTYGLFDENDNLAATGSSFGATLRCFAVDRAHQGEGDGVMDADLFQRDPEPAGCHAN